MPSDHIVCVYSLYTAQGPVPRCGEHLAWPFDTQNGAFSPVLVVHVPTFLCIAGQMALTYHFEWASVSFQCVITTSLLLRVLCKMKPPKQRTQKQKCKLKSFSRVVFRVVSIADSLFSFSVFCFHKTCIFSAVSPVHILRPAESTFIIYFPHERPFVALSSELALFYQSFVLLWSR